MFFRKQTLMATTINMRLCRQKPRLGRGSELRPVYMGTWGRGSQWCNRLLWIVVILRSRFFVWGKGKREGKGGDEGRLAFEEIGKERGQTFLLAMQRYQERPAAANRHSTSS